MNTRSATLSSEGDSRGLLLLNRIAGYGLVEKAPPIA
jgi:hypothetical protein